MSTASGLCDREKTHSQQLADPFAFVSVCTSVMYRVFLKSLVKRWANATHLSPAERGENPRLRRNCHVLSFSPRDLSKFAEVLFFQKSTDQATNKRRQITIGASRRRERERERKRLLKYNVKGQRGGRGRDIPRELVRHRSETWTQTAWFERVAKPR